MRSETSKSMWKPAILIRIMGCLPFLIAAESSTSQDRLASNLYLRKYNGQLRSANYQLLGKIRIKHKSTIFLNNLKKQKIPVVVSFFNSFMVISKALFIQYRHCHISRQLWIWVLESRARIIKVSRSYRARIKKSLPTRRRPPRDARWNEFGLHYIRGRQKRDLLQ